MKIGIVTVQDVNNFGSFLQAYALQHVLNDMGHEIYFIRSSSPKYVRGLFYRIRPYGKEWKNLSGFIAKNYNGWKKHRIFVHAQKCFHVIENYQDESLDLVILGSDEIWNVQNLLFRAPVFYGESMSPVMAYGISIGQAEIDEMACIPPEAFYRIHPILARDAHTIDFLRTLKIDAPRVCDPTLLVDKAIFRHPYRNHLMEKSPYLLVYSYGHEIDDQIRESILAFARKQELRVLSACFPIAWCDGTFNCSPLEFCAVMEKASYVFTTTFHGTIFSILNHKQFVSMAYSKKTSDLLQSVNLIDREITFGNCTFTSLESKMIFPIDYTAVDENLAQQRCNSLEHLKKGLDLYAHN